MNKKIIKNVLIITIIMIILTLIAIFIIVKNKYKPEVTKKVQEEQIQQEQITEVTEDRVFYKVNNIINTYLDAINKSKYVTREGESFAETEEIKNSIYNMLSEEYIKENQITVDNIYNNVYDIKEKFTFIPLEMNVIEDFGISKYIAYGEAINTTSNNQTTKPIYIIVNVDEIEGTFSIEQLKKEYNNINEIKVENNIEEIKENENNKFDKELITDEYIALQKFNNFKMLNIADSRLIYDKYLDTQYKEARFPTYEDYVNYLKISVGRFTTMTLYQYSSKKEGTTLESRYTDQQGCYYIFKQTKSSDYTVTLDAYTVPDEEYKKQYTSATNRRKVLMNITKWVEMINYKDYIAAYNVLDETFRKNKYGTVEEFAKQLESMFTTGCEVETVEGYDTYKEENGTYVQKIQIKGKGNENVWISGDVIMQLKEEGNFVMSTDLNAVGFE